MRLLLPVIVSVLRAILAIAGALIRLSPARALSMDPWPKPSGPHPVGRCDLVLESTPRLAARAWYPRAEPGGNRAMLYSEADVRAIRAGQSILPTAVLEHFGRTKTSAFEDKAPEGINPSCPLVIFSHGLGGHVAQNTVLAEELSSHGFLVVSIAHSGGAAAIAWPGGEIEVMSSEQRRKLVLNPDAIKSARTVRRARSVSDLRVASLKHATIEPLASECRQWASNITAAISAVSNDPRLGPYIDLRKVAAVGMSFGGAASAVAGESDGRIHAVVNLDGGQFCADLFEREPRTPLLLLQSEAAKLPEGRAWNDFFYERPGKRSIQKLTRYWAVGAGHLDFTDLTLVGRPVIRSILGLHAPQGPAMAKDLSAVVLTFLRGALCRRHVEMPQNSVKAFKPHVPKLRDN
jgi:predicted dienelactone hydrolase